MASKTLSINRAPVLTLWAAVVAQRLGFERDEGLTLGRAVAVGGVQDRDSGWQAGLGARGQRDLGLIELLAREEGMTHRPCPSFILKAFWPELSRGRRASPRKPIRADHGLARCWHDRAE